MTKDNQLAYWAAVRSDLKMFLRHTFGTVYPGKAFLDNWHLDAVLYNLTLARQGKQQRLIVNMPPRALKSFMISVIWPAFILGHDPGAKLINVSYSDELGKVLSRDFRRIVESDWYRKLFPEVVITKSTENEVVTSAGGGRFAISVGGSLTGRGADIIVVDDPIKPEDALSDKARIANNQWFNSTLLSRLDDKTLGVLVIVMQRLHVNDLTGFIENTGGFVKLSLPSIAPTDERIRTGPGDKDFYNRPADEALHEKREGLETLQKLREQMGKANFAAQYQQHPDAPEGNMFKKKYLTVIPSRLRYSNDRYWISIDAAASTSESADYTAITVGCSSPEAGFHYILYAMRGRWDYEKLLRIAMELHNRYPEAHFIVENASAGISLIQTLWQRGLKVIPHTAREDKVYRAARALPAFADGRVRLVGDPESSPWMRPFMNELLSFPNGRYDDQVDSVVQAIYNYDNQIANPSKVYEFW